MNEVKQAWSTFRSPSKASTLSVASNTASTTTWYDVPAPIIIHCREFRDEEEKSIDAIDKGLTKNDIIETEALYQNNVEAALNSLSKVCTEAPKVELDLEKTSKSNDETSVRKRHSCTVELTATNSVKTDSDGVPTISFSFLQTNERVDMSTLKETPVEEDGKLPPSDPLDQLYDFPKSSCKDQESSPSGVESVQLPRNETNGVIEKSDKEEVESPADSKEVYDSPNTKDRSAEEAEKVTERIVTTVVDLPRRKDRDGLKRSTRSLKSGRRSYGTSDSDGYDAGIASMSGSYSDPECPDGYSSVSRQHGRLTVQKRRLGKAWGKMRSWLREEKLRIGEVVTRHARMQAVGALSSENSEESGMSGSRCGSYDLTRARTQELGSITRVEEFGLSSVLEETNCPEIDRATCSVASESKKTAAEEEIEPIGYTTNYLRNKTMSSDNILGNGDKMKLPPVSFSMDKLCSDTENDETTATSNNNVTGETSESTTARDHAGKGGLIKRRMLGSIRGLMASTHLLQTHEAEEGGQGGFEDVRRYVKQGGDFCKELAAILHERAELEATYAKGLSKLSSKLTKACAKDQGGNSAGGVNEAWRCVGEEMEAAAEAHRVWGIALGEQLAKPLRVGVAEAQGRSRKSIENSVDKASKSLQEWRGIAAKSKKQSFSSARENERLQDLARLQSISQSQQNNNKSSTHHMTEKEASKLEARRRKAEDSSRRADTEFYTVSVRAERARLEYESTVRKGAKQMELLEEERLSALKDLANVYLAHLQALAPRLQQSADRLSAPIRNCNVSHDVEILKNLIRRIDSNDATNAEQLLPDFYAEHVTLAMNRERRKQSLVRVLHLIRQDLDRERRGREGLETLHRAFIKTPAFAADESTQNVTEKLLHMRSMLMYLEAARYKVGGTLAEVEGSKRDKHPLAEHILVSRDKQGLQQSVLKIPSWAKNESFEFQDGEDDLEVHLTKDHESENRDWADRTAGDGNSENPPDEDDFSDFDEFSSHSEDNNNQDVETVDVATKSERAEQCRAIYQYSANLNDELSLNPGDLITVHQKQADGWWIGECRGRTGIFPATYVQVIH